MPGRILPATWGMVGCLALALLLDTAGSAVGHPLAGGERLWLAQAEPEAEISEEEMAELMETGDGVYRDFCSACHASNGRGDIGPALTGGALADAHHVYRQINEGRSEMPGFGGVLSEEEILAVGTFVRNRFGNSHGPLTRENAGIAE